MLSRDIDESPFNVISDEVTQTVCSACLNHINDNEYIEALNKEWHSDCFRYAFF